MAAAKLVSVQLEVAPQEVNLGEVGRGRELGSGGEAGEGGGESRPAGWERVRGGRRVGAHSAVERKQGFGLVDEGFGMVG